MTMLAALYDLLKEAQGAYQHLHGAQKARFLKAYGRAFHLLSPGQKAALTKRMRHRG